MQEVGQVTVLILGEFLAGAAPCLVDAVRRGGNLNSGKHCRGIRLPRSLSLLVDWG